MNCLVFSCGWWLPPGRWLSWDSYPAIVQLPLSCSCNLSWQRVKKQALLEPVHVNVLLQKPQRKMQCASSLTYESHTKAGSNISTSIKGVRVPEEVAEGEGCWSSPGILPTRVGKVGGPALLNDQTQWKLPALITVCYHTLNPPLPLSHLWNCTLHLMTHINVVMC